jgi:drug/metabolite transporter (DMT)-like permease
MNSADPPITAPPARWAVILAFALVYICWGTTYLAIGVGVDSFPPALFAGTRTALAGLIMLIFLAVRGDLLRLSKQQLLWACVTAFFFFVLGSGLITAGEKTVKSSVAAVLVATTPIWAAVVEMFWPHGDRLTLRGWLGLFIGLGGVCVLLSDKLVKPETFDWDIGPFMIVASAAAWAVGACVLRHRRHQSPHLSGTAYQMIIGGTCLSLIGVAFGEIGEFDWDRVTAGALYSFFHLLVFGSLIGYVAYAWLLRHVTVTQAGTYAYVNPMVAILVGWLLGDEPLSLATIGGMAIVLAGVALVRTGERASTQLSDEKPPPESTISPDHYSPPARRLECQKQDS